MARNKTVDRMMAAVREADEKVFDAKPEDLDAATAAMQGEEPPPEPAEPEPEPAPPPEPAEPEPPPPPEPAPKLAKPAEAPASDDTEKLRLAIERERRESARLRAQLASLQQVREQAFAAVPPQQQLTGAGPSNGAGPAPIQQPQQAAPPPPPQDPEPPRPGEEPDEQQFPIEHDTWERRSLRYDLWRQRQEQRAQISEMQQQLASVNQRSEQASIESQFDEGVSYQKTSYLQEHPEFDEAREKLKQVLIDQAVREGNVESHMADNWMRAQERQYLAIQMNKARVAMQQGLLPPETNIAHYAFDMLLSRARDAGFSPQPAARQNGRAGMTPQERVRDTAARASAGRAASTMRGATAALPDGEPMTAARFMEMTMAQRQAYKKAHPSWESELGFEEPSGNFIIGSR